MAIFTPLLILCAMLSAAHALTVYTAGDSTMAKGGGGVGTDGWGQYLQQYFNVTTVNSAIAGRSARSYTEEGRFATLINTVASGDYVVIEFGHNDGQSGTTDNGRQDAYGKSNFLSENTKSVAVASLTCPTRDGYDTSETVTLANGSSQVIHTFTYYIQNAVTALQAKGAHVIVSAQTPSDDWTGDEIVAPPRFVPYAATSASRTGAAYIDHYAYVAQAYEAIGQATIVTYYPLDHTHTAPTAANIVAEAFVRGLICIDSPLAVYVNSAGQAAPNGCI